MHPPFDSVQLVDRTGRSFRTLRGRLQLVLVTDEALPAADELARTQTLTFSAKDSDARASMRPGDVRFVQAGAEVTP